VTAFYASFQKSSRSIVYCNAGHCSPYVIDQTGVRELEGVKSVPLGLWSNDELRLRNRAFSNVEINLIADSRVLFYTDGLTETRCENGDLMFEEGPLQENLVATRQQTSAAAVEHLHRALARFHGSDSFEDDVCVICLDVK
jgi:sigma-B regulation protein RsbU (phosphoserine phosphatase)